MNKYFAVFQSHLQQYFVYRLSFVLWRFRVLLNLILIFYLWNAIFLNQRVVLGYSRNEMLTYVILISTAADIVFSSKIHELSGEILSGGIINQLLRPLSVIVNLILKEAADKFLNIVFTVLTVFGIVLFTKTTIIWQTDPMVLFVGAIFLILGTLSAFFLSFCISMVAFWTAEIWAPRFIYFILVFVLAGNYFPLDILPDKYYQILLFTPFPYFIFMPVKVYLHGLPPNVIQLLLIAIAWVVITWVSTIALWKKGMREFSFYGR